MAGRKHHLQQFGTPAGKGFNHIEDPFERDFAFRSMTAMPYCKHCGEQVLQAYEDADGVKIDAEWEMQNKAHFKCHSAHQEVLRNQAAKAAAEEQKRREEFDFDKYMEELMKQRGE